MFTSFHQNAEQNYNVEIPNKSYENVVRFKSLETTAN
jgi:hypothetical protein